MTTDASHVLADATVAPESFYVAMTRGRRTNDAYLVLDPPRTGQGDLQHAGGTAASEQWTRGEVLHAIATNTGAQSSAHEVIGLEQDRAGSIEQLAAEAETIASYAQTWPPGNCCSPSTVTGPPPLRCSMMTSSTSSSPRSAQPAPPGSTSTRHCPASPARCRPGEG
ncbi:MAG: hypothetical protein ABJD68_17420 [Nakamurella sp.]